MKSLSSDPLDELGYQAKELQHEDRARLARMIRSFVRIEFSQGQIRFTPEAGRLNTKQRVLVYLLAKLALAEKNSEFSRGATPTEVEEATRLAGGTVRPKLSELVKDGVVEKVDKVYEVQLGSIPYAERVLEGKLSPDHQR